MSRLKIEGKEVNPDKENRDAKSAEVREVKKLEKLR